VGTIVEFPPSRQKPKLASALKASTSSRAILTCPCCARDFLAERFSDGRLVLTAIEYKTVDPNDADLDIPFFDELRAGACAPVEGEREGKEKKEVEKMNERPSVIRLTAADIAWGDDGHDTMFVERQSVVLVYSTSPEVMAGGSRFVSGAKVGGWVVPQGDKRVPMDTFVGHILGFDTSHPEFTLGGGENDRGVKIHDHGAMPPEDMDFIKVGGGVSKKIGLYPAGLVNKTGHYRLGLDGKPHSKVVPTISVYMLVNGHGCVYAAYGTAFPPVRDDLVIRAERLRVMAEGEGGKPEELKGCTLGKFQFASRFEKKAFECPVPVITLVGKLGDANGPTLAEWRQAKALRKALKEGGDWAPIKEALDPPAPPAEALPHRSSHSGKSLTEINPPPPEDDESNWEVDDRAPW
jgi:hypothetical protein